MILNRNTIVFTLIVSMLTLNSCATTKKWEEEAQSKKKFAMETEQVNTYGARPLSEDNLVNSVDNFNEPKINPFRMAPDPKSNLNMTSEYLDPSEYEEYLRDSGQVLK